MLEKTATAPRRLPFDQLDPPALHRRLAADGYAYVDGVPAEFDHAGWLAANVGPLMPQYDGQTIWSIKAEPRYEGVYHSLNMQPLTPHTECYEWAEVPPRYLALWCVVPGEDSGGQTTLGDGYAFLDTLTAPERELLASRQWQFVSTAGLQEMELGRVARHPILERRPGRSPVLRFTCRCIHDPDGDPFLAEFRERLLGFFDDTHVAVSFEPRALLVWDNHRLLHSRTGYSDPRRHLRRVWLGERPAA